MTIVVVPSCCLVLSRTDVLLYCLLLRLELNRHPRKDDRYIWLATTSA